MYVVDGVGAHAELLEQLGPHTTGVGCIYVKDLTAVDLGVLETIVSRSYAALTAGTYTKRAHEGGNTSATSSPTPTHPPPQTTRRPRRHWTATGA